MNASIKQTIVDFEESLEWLQSLITDPSGSRYFKEKNRETILQELHEQLWRTTRFLEFANNPQTQFHSIQIAGTSGKGSVAITIANILTACQCKIGLHMSPYLQVCNEKLIINGRMIKPSEFIELVTQFEGFYKKWTAKNMTLSYTEAWAVLTFLWFAKNHLDWAVIETGMGGRFDPTNVIHASVAVITNVNFDHMKQLGHTLTDIAFHKAGIVKNKSLVVTSETNEQVLQVIQNEVQQKEAQLYQLGKDFSFTLQRLHDKTAVISVTTPFSHYEEISLSLKGTFQLTNAALAITAVDILREYYGIPLSQECLQSTLNNIQFPGRMEVIQEKPLVILDGAHNSHKVKALTESIQTLYPQKKIAVMIGGLMTKDMTSMISHLLPLASHFIVTAPNVYGKPSLQPQVLQDMIHRMSHTMPVKCFSTVQKSVEWALHELKKDEGLLITGSLYLIGEARNYWITKAQLLERIESDSGGLFDSIL